MKILGCGLGSRARAGASSEETCGRGARVAWRGPSIRSIVGMSAMGVVALALAACGGGGGGSGGGGGGGGGSPPPTQYTIGGTVTGLSGTVVLQDNGGDNLSVTQSGSFTFATKVNSGGAYAVTVMTQPSGQTCTVASGSGTASANVTTVAVTCANASSGVTIGGTVTGLTGTGLALLDNGGDSLSVSQNGTFTFATALATGAAYAVTVGTQPSGQMCTVASGSGTTASANITNVAVTCATSAASVGKFAYTASNTAGTIYAYTIDATTGALTLVGTPYPDGTHPAAVSLAPNGKFAFSASDGGTEIHAFTIDQTSGALMEVAGSPFPVTGFTTGSANPDIAVDPQSTHLYLASAADALVAGFAIDPTSGKLTPIAGSPYAAGTNAGGIPAFTPDGKYLYVVNQNATGSVSGYAVDPTSGQLTPLTGSPFPAGSNPYWVAFTADGKYAYVANNGADSISAYSVTAGVLTALTTPTFATDEHPEDLTIDATGTHLYAPVGNGGANGAVDAYTINADGTLTVVTGSPYPVGIGPRFVNIDPSGRFAYVSSAGSGGTGVFGFSITATTGALTALAGSPFPTGAGSEPQFITIDPSGKFAYTANQGTGTISEFTIDQTSGVLAAIAGSPLPTGTAPFFVSISPEAPGIRD